MWSRSHTYLLLVLGRSAMSGPRASLAVLGAVVLLAAQQGAALDPADYCNIHVNHTLCLHQAGDANLTCGKVLHLGLDEAEKVLVLDLHNRKRALIASGQETRGDPGPQPPAANMMELDWDPELEAMAQVWAERCIPDHDCPDCRRSRRFPVGQNLYQFGHFSGSWERSVDGWYNEVADFNRSFVFPFYTIPGLLVGHYTQMTWAQTTRIGCGKIFHHPKGSKWANQIYVCNYGLAGNLIRSEMYKAGPACSACPSGTACSDKYPGLCAGTPEKPLTVRPPVFPWEVPGGFPTRRPLIVTNRTLITSGNQQVPAPPGGDLGPDAIVNLEFVKPATVVPDVDGGEDLCAYTCDKDGGCGVKIITNRLVHGAVLGHCFAPGFGGSCSGTPKGCRRCSDPCKDQGGFQITFAIKGTKV